jgi:general secretion pathway protein D
MKIKRLSVVGLTLVLALQGVEWPLLAKTKKGEKFLKDGRAAEARGDWEAALQLYEQAVGEDPSDASYLAAMRKARFEAGQKHVDAGQKLRAEGKLEEALQEFQKALVADPSSAIAIQEIRRVQGMLANPQTGAPDERGLTPAERMRRQSEQRVNSMTGPPQLKPATALIPAIKMNNQPPRVLFETVGKLAGVNVVFDPQFNPPARNFNVDLSNTTVEQAFDYLATLTHTFWKPITANAIFVAEDNPTKRRDYEDDVVKVFYVTNATTVQEFQEIATAIRTVAEIRRVFTYNAQRAMVVRDTVDKVALAEKLVHDLDKPKSEVVVDVIVMEANSERTRDLAATIASAGTAGINVPITYIGNSVLGVTQQPGTTTPGTTTPGTGTPGAAAPGSALLSRLGHLSTNQFAATLPGFLLQAMLSDNSTKVLNNPQLRASDGQKVTLKIGNRIPYATGSFQTNTAAALVSTQFNYADVGVNVDMTPQVHSADEVSLHVEVTVSSVQNYVNIGGISQPVIGQRSNIADIRLHEGEVNILGGLSQNQDVTTVNGIPGLVNIPVLGKFLFGSYHTDKVRGDLMIALVPHIVRTPDYTAENLRGIYAGTDQVVKINYAAPPAAAAAPSNGAAGPGGAGAPPAPAPVPAPAKPPANAAPAAPVSRTPARVSFQPATIEAAPGAQVSVTLQADNAANVTWAGPLRVKYNPEVLRLDDVVAGNLLAGNGATAETIKDIRNDVGEATITIQRQSGAPSATGSGGVAVLTFTAIGPGETTVTLPEITLRDAQGQTVPAAAGALGVKIQ